MLHLPSPKSLDLIGGITEGWPQGPLEHEVFLRGVTSYYLKITEELQ